jgi:hypothetical protein
MPLFFFDVLVPYLAFGIRNKSFKFIVLASFIQGQFIQSMDPAFKRRHLVFA